MPSCEDEWRVVANDYDHRWNFYNCVGAMDGKHFKIDPPLQCWYKWQNDTGIWNKCSLKAHPDNNSLNISVPTRLPNIDKEFPFVFVGDEGFPLSTKVLIPYSRDTCGNKNKRIFNYRLSRARNKSENAFGVMGARFQIFRSAIRYDPDDASKIILTCCCLHNMLRTEVVGRHMYTPPEFIDEDEFLHRLHPGEWLQESALGMINLRNQGGNRHANATLQFRDEWCNYFNGEGAVPWQDYMINK